MSGAFTKLFSSLLDSTLWVNQPHHVVRVWVAMLAMADRDGFVAASIPGLARRSCVTLAEAEEALAVFLAPDPYSRTPDHEGRRIQTVGGGWVLLNYPKYRRTVDAEQEKMRKREYMRSKRAAEHSATSATVPKSSESGDVASASLSASGSVPDPDPGAEPVPVVPGLTIVGAPPKPHPGPLKPSRRDQADAHAALSQGQLMHRYPSDFEPTKDNQARGLELGLTEAEIWQRWDECRDKRYPSPFDNPVAQFNRELAWAKADKAKQVFKSQRERDAFEMPGKERRA